MFHYLRKFPHKRIRVYNRFQSSKKQEENFLDKMKRWSKITSPLLLFGFVSTFVVGNLTCRHYMESIFPSYVQFLRDYYGFDDEDKDERARVLAIEASNARSVNVNVVFGNGECLEDVSFEGNVPYPAMIQMLEEKYQSKVCKISFSDCEETVDSEENDAKIFDEVALNTVSSNGLEGFASSCWDPLPSVTDEGPETQNPLLVEITKETVVKRYENISLKAAMERSRIDDVRESMRLNNNSGYQLGIPSEQTKHDSKPAAFHDDVKNEVLQSISRLEERIAELEKEMQIGKKDVDTASADIQKARDEIRALKRQHINRFYFF